MTASTICRRVRHFGKTPFLTSKFTNLVTFNAANHTTSVTNYRPCSSIASSSTGRPASRYMDTRAISQLVASNGNHLFLVDTLSLVRKLEAQGLASKQAEAITGSITAVLRDSLEDVGYSFMSKSEMQKFMMVQESHLNIFQSETQSSQEYRFSMLQRDMEKLQGEIERLRSDLKHGTDKVAAVLRLELNHEKGNVRDELAKQSSETGVHTNQLDKEIQELKAKFEATKFEIMRYCVGTLVSISAVGIAVIRLSQSQ